MTERIFNYFRGVEYKNIAQLPYDEVEPQSGIDKVFDIVVTVGAVGSFLLLVLAPV